MEAKPLNYKSGRIRDPVHDYIQFTKLEHAILSHRVTQRLRYISQNGLTHLVYPEARGSRFSHALGSMHLSSQFLASSLHNADKDTEITIMEGLKANVRATLGGGVAASESRIKAISQSLDGDILLAHHFSSNYDDRPYILLAEQALRLAALFHDLGHLPFSHDFEQGLNIYWSEHLSTADQKVSQLHYLYDYRGDHQSHEYIGHRLAQLVFGDLYSRSFPDDLSRVAQVVLDLTDRIFHADVRDYGKPCQPVLLWLISLIDGDIDVDRCDYILRDGRHFGFEFGDFDLNRLVSNLVVVPVDGELTVAVLPQAISSVESFLISRFRSYQYGHWHHKAAQVGTALQASIAHCLRNHRPEDQVSAFIDDLGNICDEKRSHTPKEMQELLDRFATYDDNWWIQVMRNVDRVGESNEWLRLVCWRTPGPVSLWKVSTEMPVGATDAKSVAEWNDRLPLLPSLDDITEWRSAVLALKAEGVLVVRHTFRAWRARQLGVDSNDEPIYVSKLSVYDKKAKTLQPLSERSAVIRALPDLWRHEVQVQAFRESNSQLRAQDVMTRLPILPAKKRENSEGSSGSSGDEQDDRASSS